MAMKATRMATLFLSPELFDLFSTFYCQGDGCLYIVKKKEVEKEREMQG